MNIKINSKSKKSEMVDVCVALGLVTKEEAESKTCKDLFVLYKAYEVEYDRLVSTLISRELVTKEEAESKTFAELKAIHDEFYKARNNVVNNSSDANADDSTPDIKAVDAKTTKKDEKVVPISKADGNGKVKRLPKKNHHKEDDNATPLANKMPKVDGSSTSDVESKLGVVAKVEKSDNIVVENNTEPTQTDDEDKIKDDIIAQISTMSALIESLQLKDSENRKSLKDANESLTKITNEFKSFYRSVVSVVNAIALTKDTELFGYYDMLAKTIRRVRSLEPIEVMDMRKLISVDIEMESKRAEAEEEARLAEENEKADARQYEDGTHILYIDGEVVKAKGVRKATFEKYVSWTDDCQEWVDYVVEEMENIHSISVLQKRKKALKSLREDLKTWYDEWVEAEVEDEIISLVSDIMDGLIKNSDVELAMAQLVEIVDGLEL